MTTPDEGRIDRSLRRGIGFAVASLLLLGTVVVGLVLGISRGGDASLVLSALGAIGGTVGGVACAVFAVLALMPRKRDQSGPAPGVPEPSARVGAVTVTVELLGLTRDDLRAGLTIRVGLDGEESSLQRIETVVRIAASMSGEPASSRRGFVLGFRRR